MSDKPWIGRNGWSGLTPHQLFWEKVEVGPGCWNWRANTDPDGYGRFWFGGKLAKAPKAALVLSGVEVPAGLCVLHHCDNRLCVRPSHLFLGTGQDNMRDMAAKGRGCGMKIAARDARWIRKAYAAGLGTHKEIATQFGVSESNVSAIVRRETWGHVPQRGVR